MKCFGVGTMHQETESESVSSCRAAGAGQSSASTSGFKTTPEATILEDYTLTGSLVSNSVCSMSDCVCHPVVTCYHTKQPLVLKKTSKPKDKHKQQTAKLMGGGGGKVGRLRAPLGLELRERASATHALQARLLQLSGTLLINFYFVQKSITSNYVSELIMCLNTWSPAMALS